MKMYGKSLHSHAYATVSPKRTPPVPDTESFTSVFGFLESLTTGMVQVKLLNSFGETISINTVTFEYTEQKDKYKAEAQKYQNYLDQEVTTPQQCTMMASLLFKKLDELQSNSKGGKSYDGKPIYT